MEETKFRLVFKAEIAPGSDLNEVKKDLGLLFKSEVSKIETLFSGKTIILRNNLSENEALKLKNSFDKTGAIAIVEPEPGKGDTATEKSDQGRQVNPRQEAPEGRPITLVAQQVTCPKCGTRQEKSESCVSCGIIYEKYRNNLERENFNFASSGSRSAGGSNNLDELGEIAAAQKLLIWAVVAGFAFVMSPVFYFVIVPFRLYAVYRISKVLRFEMVFRIICVVCMFVPFLGIILLLVLNSKATKALSSAGIRVGLTGASQSDLDALGAGVKGGSILAPAFIAVLLIIAVAGLSSGLLPSYISWKDKYGKSSVEKEIARANKQFPKQIDAETRIDSVAAGPGKLVTYNYTLTNHSAADLDVIKFRGVIVDKIKQETCRNSETKPYIQNGYTIAFSYNGKDGNPVTTVTVTPDDCGNL